MRMMRIAGALLLTAVAAAAAAPLSDFIAVSRAADETWLLKRGGQSLFVQRGTSAPLPAATFHLRDGRPFPWDREPLSLVRWRDRWLVANGGRNLWEFAGDGAFIDAVPAPSLITDVAAGAGVLWAYSAAAPPGLPSLWISSDARRFSPVQAAVTGGRGSPEEHVIAAQLIVAVSPRQELLFVHAAGAPELTRVGAGGAARAFPLAYSRSTARARLERFRPDAHDLTAYSQPARDVAVDGRGQIVVLRNREDVRDRGKLAAIRGLRADRYSSDGRHLATATFPATVRFILRSDASRVLGLTDTGVVVTAAFGPPIAGGIVP